MRNIILTVVAVLVSLTSYAQTYYANVYEDFEGITDETVKWDVAEVIITEGSMTLESQTFNGVLRLDNLVQTDEEWEFINDVARVEFYLNTETNAMSSSLYFNDKEYNLNFFLHRKLITMADFKKDFKL